MCELRSNESGNEGLDQLRKSGETKFVKKLVKLANDDSVTAQNGLSLFLEPILSWQHDPNLRQVRKYRIGNHRVYVLGQHTDCRYTLVYVKVNKRANENREEWPEFKNKILRSLREEGEIKILGGA